MSVSLCRELPAKSAAEAKKHQKMYEQIVATARKKGQQCQFPVLSCLQLWTVSNKSDKKGQWKLHNFQGKSYIT